MAATRASTSFIFITILLDVIGFGLIIPVMPKMVSKFTSSEVETNYWYMVMTASYGIMQFFFSPILGALSDKFGRRPVILISIVGLGIDFILQGIAWSIPVLFAARVLGGSRRAVLARELTKRYETLLDGTLDALVLRVRSDLDQQRGEIVLVIAGAPEAEADSKLAEGKRLYALLSKELPPAKAAKLAAAWCGLPKRALYGAED